MPVREMTESAVGNRLSFVGAGLKPAPTIVSC